MVIISCPNTAPQAGPSSRRQDFTHAYQRIRSSSRTSASSNASSPVLLLVSPDVDAICATRILTTLLAEDDIPFRIIPVQGYRGLLHVLRQDLQHNQDVRSVVMLNLGSVLSLPTTIPLPPTCTLHVVDSHRPWNLDNLFATTELNGRVWIWDDGEIESKLERQGGEREAFERLEFDVDASDSEADDDDDDDEQDSDMSSDSDDDDDDDDDSGSDRDSEARRSQDHEDAEEHRSQAGQRKRQRRSRSSASVGDNNNDEDGADGAKGNGDPERSARKRRKKQSKPRQQQQRPDRPARLTGLERQRLRNILSRYYNRGTGVGMSVAGMMYLLADKLGRGGRDGLWLAILGLTSQYLVSTISTDSYDAFASAFASEVHAIEPALSSAAAIDPWSSDSISTSRDDSSKDRVGSRSSGTDPDADDAAIRVVPTELRFTLYRHWSLESSMYHTAYVASKLGVWREKGMSKLRGLMAKMGFSLSNCRQHFPHMALDLRKTLVTRLEQIAPEYGLTELTYRGFVRGFGFRSTPLSAADVVEGLSALLVAAHGVKIEVEVPGMGFVSGGTGVNGGSPLGNSLVGNGVGSSGPGGGGGIGSELFNGKRVWSLSSSSSSSTSPSLASAAASASTNGSNDRSATDAAVPLPDTQPDPSTVESSTVWRKNFYEAYRALDRGPTSIALLRSSLLLSQSLHRAIIGRGTSLIINQSIRTLKNFRLAILKDGPDLELFTHVDVLAKLARWLVDALRDVVVEQDRARQLGRKKRKKSGRRGSRRTGTTGSDGGREEDDEDEDASISLKPLPFLLAALDPLRDVFLVLGQVGAPTFGDVEPNRFGLAFQEAASKSGARVRHDRFETAAVEVRRSDLSAFVEAVHVKG